MPETSSIEYYNVGSGVEYSVAEMIDLWAAVLGQPVKAKSVPARCRKGDRKNQLSNTAKLQRDCRWKPKRNLETALREVWMETITQRSDQLVAKG